LTSVEIVIRENPVVYEGGAEESSITLTDDLKSCTIDLPINLYQRKNKIQLPEPSEFFSSLRSCIERSDKEYKNRRERFDLCDLCKGKGMVTTIIDTQVELSGERVTVGSEVGPTEICQKCHGTGLVTNQLSD
jgi:DnaJ-class molecular chaperone